MPGARSYAVGSFALTLDGVQCGFVHAAEGGDAVAEIVREPGGPEYYVKKHLGALRYEDVVVEVGLGLASELYDWIAASWKASYDRKDGAIVAADHTLKVVSERQFFDALLAETTIPALDASSKDSAYLTIAFAPEYTKTVKGQGKLGSAAKQPQKAWLRSNFRLELDGLDCTRVSRIDSFTVRHTVAADDVGEARDLGRELAKLEFPNLRVTLAEAGADSWQTWFDAFVLQGANDDSKEKTGAIVFLSPDRKTELARIALFGVGIAALRHTGDARADAVRRLTAELYCERMELHLPKGKPAAPAIRKPVVRIDR